MRKRITFLMPFGGNNWLLPHYNNKHISTFFSLTSCTIAVLLESTLFQLVRASEIQKVKFQQKWEDEKTTGTGKAGASILPALSFLWPLFSTDFGSTWRKFYFWVCTHLTGEGELHKIQYFIPVASTNISTACNYGLGSSQAQLISKVKDDILE